MLYAHQTAGAAWLAARNHGYLGDVPGLGKTRTIIEALRLRGARHPLVVCPAIVRSHWVREFTAMGWPWDMHDAPRIKSYDEIVRGGFPLMKQLLDDGVGALVLDEAHRTKHAGAQRTQLLLGRDGYARRVPIVYAASGTPVPKNPYSFWTILSSLFPEIALAHGLKTANDFKGRFCTVRWKWTRGQPREKILPQIKNPEEFREILDAVMLRRTLDDVGLDVPAIDWQLLKLDGPRDDSAWEGVGEWPDPVGWYRTQRDAAAMMRADLDADKLTLDEIANDPHVARMRRRLGELKVAPVVEMLKSQLEDSDEKIVVFAHHREVMRGLAEGLVGFGLVGIHGDTPDSRRALFIDEFQHNPKIRVFIGQNIACMEGMDGLQHAARRAILVEPDWTRDVNEQLGKRVARIGQGAGHCVVQMIALADTLDEAIVGQNLQEVRMAAKIGLGEK